jgi:hypothetical protein
MNKSELAQTLKQEGFRPDAYDIEGAGQDERYCLRELHSVWSVYYSERGLQSGKKDFGSESEACDYFLQLLRKDATTRAK